MNPATNYIKKYTHDYLGGLAGMMVGLPATIAYGLLSFAPMGPKYASWAVMGALLGTVPICFLSPIFGGIKTLISAPTAATAAVISVFVAELVDGGKVPIADIPLLITLLCMLTGLLQMIVGIFGGGKFIKYIPVPVFTGYLTGLCLLIIIAQLPKLLSLPQKTDLTFGLFHPRLWRWESLCIGSVTILFMAFARVRIKKFPAVVIGLSAGIAAYWCIAIYEPSLRSLSDNPFVLGRLPASPSDIVSMLSVRWLSLPHLTSSMVTSIVLPAIEIMLLLSITTLNSCLVIDALTFTNHSPKKELWIQGMGNFAAGLCGGICGAGSLTTTVENIRSGGRSHRSVIFAGINTLIIVFFLIQYVSWIPKPSLAGILIVVAFGLIDFKIFSLVKYKSTIFDFFVIIAVVVAATRLDLLRGAGVGIFMAILLFIKQQMGATVIRRKVFGNQLFSKTIRSELEQRVLELKGDKTLIIELHGQLFFGTSDQLFSKLEPYFGTCQYFVLDMHRIQSLDYTAANILAKILARISDQNGYLIFTAIPETLSTGQRPKEYLKNIGLLDGKNLKLFSDLDSALAWIENNILIAEHLISDDKLLQLDELEFFNGFSEASVQAIESCIDKKKYAPGAYVFHSNSPEEDNSDDIFFIRKGNVKLILPLNDGHVFHLQTICMGAVFGEMAFIDNSNRSADAVAVDEVHLFALSRKKFNHVTIQNPELSGLFFERLAFIIANRLRKANMELKVLSEN